MRKTWMIFGAFAALVIFLQYNEYQKKQMREQKRAEKKAACLISPSCQDDIARRDSDLYTGRAIRSKFGRYYFNGTACTDDCSGHVAGFNWAEERGISKEAGCEDGKSISFIEGCEAYVEAV